MSVGSSSSCRQWFGWTVRIVVAVAMLTFVAHALHQTVGQMIGGAISSVSRALNPDNGLISRITGDRTGPDITITPTSGPLPAHIIVTGTGYGPREKVEITAHIVVLATAVADDHGNFTATVRVSADTFCPRHQCEITASGKRDLKWITAPFDVTN